ncbi:hypothetical protein IGS59_25390 [Janthinobacterium sp. GW460P]|uniref:hypothetical protein n=1 Tax=unclassified Janthinobacterium TaxID=2610881 RepID=UPI00111BDAC2|nr:MULTISPECIES: hypothetical protein [unclassified Janthinobacterium]MCC7705580.1 hypothetical protein [Janthinobacterium sp. GW460P]MCC7711082.1 hypothetical protein [Janthinobacterium sp. GW460W]
MHTAVFESVLAKLKRGGRERLDGFALEEFSGITSSEWITLVEIFKRDNDFSALSLLLSNDDFFELLRNKIYSQDANSNDYVSALIYAHKFGAIDDAVERLIMAIDGLPHWPLGTALSYLSLVPIPEVMVGIYLKSLFGIVISGEGDPVLLLKSAGEILRVKDYIPKTSDYVNMLARLRNPDKRIRLKAISEISTL